ncbi:acyl- n-acyltransferase [Moniliophthora roreri MCA 2997]|uniref:Acyl-n-acyltransferase n=1 Tax=Moniliophthora roreri (strain MCA 2997) TaxID=1381753 RepID=V2XHD1_MONRO|nr:acyl- n-acyltransferase [Moniliophthora roreri MCA 2997]
MDDKGKPILRDGSFTAREIQPDEVEKVSEIMTSAFLDDRNICWISGMVTPPLSTDSPDGRDFILFFRMFIVSTLLGNGRTVIAVKRTDDGKEDIGGVAAWYPPGKRLEVWNPRKMRKAGMYKLMKRWGVPALLRGLHMMECAEVATKQAFKERSKIVGHTLKPLDSWYLQAIMTTKVHEGKGLMSLLQREGFAHAIKVAKLTSTEVKPICLEASSERARDRYAHLGYQFAPNQPIVLGQGKVNANGLKTSSPEEATGIRLYAMINWDPDPEHGCYNPRNDSTK